MDINLCWDINPCLLYHRRSPTRGCSDVDKFNSVSGSPVVGQVHMHCKPTIIFCGLPDV